MENKEIIIIALVVIAICLYVSYYRHLDSDTKLLTQAEEKIVELRNQVQHYQSLYQKRVEKDLDAETLNSDWETRYNQLENLNNQTNREKNELAKYQVLIEKKVEDLENQLINLAKQKIKGKKEAERLLSELETKWNQDKEKWQHNQQILQKLQEFHHLVEKSPSHSLDRNQVNQAEKLVEQITQPEIKQLASWMITDSAFILGHNNLLTKLATQEDKLEETHEQVKLLTQKNQDLTEELKLKGEFYQEEIEKFNQLKIDLEKKENNLNDLNNSYITLEKTNQKQQEIIAQLDKDKTKLILEMRGYQNQEQTIKDNLAKIEAYGKLAEENKELHNKNSDLLKDKENLTNSLTQQEQQNKALNW